MAGRAGQESRDGMDQAPARPKPDALSSWNFLSNHAHVLLTIAADPEVRLCDVAARIGITERAVQRILADLVRGCYLDRERTGRRNRYRIHPELPMRHPLLAHAEVGSLLRLLRQGRPGQSGTS